MARLSWSNDPHGCFADAENDKIAEMMFAAHQDEHSANWEKGCEWCEAERDAEEAEAALELSVCCGKRFVEETDLCSGCREHSSSERDTEEAESQNARLQEDFEQQVYKQADLEDQQVKEVKELAFIARHSCEKCGELVVPGFYCVKCGEVPDWRKKQ